MKRIVIKSLKEMREFAAKFAKTLKGGEVLALTGELGAGKTSFVQGLAKALGIKAVVQSPTFLLMKCYRVKGLRPHAAGPVKRVVHGPLSMVHTLCHIDAYRIKTPRELMHIGASEKIGDPQTVTAIEWADRVKAVIPKNAITISFAHGKKNNERVVFITRN